MSNEVIPDRNSGTITRERVKFMMEKFRENPKLETPELIKLTEERFPAGFGIDVRTADACVKACLLGHQPNGYSRSQMDELVKGTGRSDSFMMREALKRAIEKGEWAQPPQSKKKEAPAAPSLPKAAEQETPHRRKEKGKKSFNNKSLAARQSVRERRYVDVPRMRDSMKGGMQSGCVPISEKLLAEVLRPAMQFVADHGIPIKEIGLTTDADGKLRPFVELKPQRVLY